MSKKTHILLVLGAVSEVAVGAGSNVLATIEMAVAESLPIHWQAQSVAELTLRSFSRIRCYSPYIFPKTVILFVRKSGTTITPKLILM